MGPAGWSGYLAFDHTTTIGSNLELRRALAHAIDRDALAAAMPANMVVATGGIVPPALQGHTPEISLRYDADEARACLARSGHAGPLSIAGLDDDEPILDPVVDGWRSVLGLQVDRVEWSLDDIATMDAPSEQSPIYFTGWLPGYADPEYFLRLLFHSQSRTNEGGFDHPPFDELIERARQERSDRGRLALFHDADRMAVVDRVAVIPLVYGRSLAVLKPFVHGLVGVRQDVGELRRPHRRSVGSTGVQSTDGNASSAKERSTCSAPASRRWSTEYSPVATPTAIVPAPCAASMSRGVSPTTITSAGSIA